MIDLLRIGMCAVASAAAVIALLLCTSLPGLVAVTVPIVAGVMLINWTGGVPETGPASIDPDRVERIIRRIIIGGMIVGLIYLLLFT
jgi:Na+-transporting NADH:ubiquinone oxidoreductase subunit NqrB